MNILLIRGPQSKNAIDLSHYTFSEPMGLQMLYGVLKENNNVEIFDMMVEKITINQKLKEKSYDLCGISSSCSDIFLIKKLAKEIKKNNNIKIFVGGFQARRTPEEFLCPYIDYIIYETNKVNLDDLINNIKNQSKANIKGVLQNHENFDNLILGEEEYFPVDRSSTEKYAKYYSYFIYKPVALIDFEKEFQLGINQFILKIQNIKEPVICFIDFDLFQNTADLEAFFNAINKNNIKKTFVCYGSKKTIQKSLDKLDFYRENGLKSIILYFAKDSIKNGIDDELIEQISKSNLSIWAYFSIYPDYTKENFKDLRDFINKTKPIIVTLYPLNPYYDKKLLETYKNKLIFDKESTANKYPGYVLIKPMFMDLSSFYWQIFYTSLFSYRRSLFPFISNFGIKNSLSFYIKSLNLIYKYLKIIIYYKKVKT